MPSQPPQASVLRVAGASANSEALLVPMFGAFLPPISTQAHCATQVAANIFASPLRMSCDVDSSLHVAGLMPALCLLVTIPDKAVTPIVRCVLSLSDDTKALPRSPDHPLTLCLSEPSRSPVLEAVCRKTLQYVHSIDLRPFRRNLRTGWIKLAP